MQTGSDHLKAQQEIMAAMNMYNGKIDGIWGPKSIAAKQKWERSGKFSPGIPNNGFPLNDRAPLPAGVVRKADGTLTRVGAASKVAVGSPVIPVAPSAPVQVVAPVQVSPAVEAPAVAAVATETTPQQTQPQNTNNQQRHGNNNPQNKNNGQK
jgi:hypothetical protein